MPSLSVPYLFAAPPPSTAPSRPHRLEALKICAVTTPTDAELVTRVASKRLPSDVRLFLGMILWPNTRRAVSIPAAREIAAAARAAGATPVAVFVDESPAEISTICKTIGVTVAQLHGAATKKSWTDRETDDALDWIDVRAVAEDGAVDNATPHGVGAPPLWTLFDAKGGGTGKPFDWSAFSPPEARWLLAGGLNPDNVAEAVDALAPAGLDVATGVAGPDKVRKDQHRLELFLERALAAYS